METMVDEGDEWKRWIEIMVDKNDDGYNSGWKR